MCAFGLFEDRHHTRFHGDLIVEANRRLDIWTLLQHGALLDEMTTELQWGEKHSRLAIHGPDLLVDGTRLVTHHRSSMAHQVLRPRQLAPAPPPMAPGTEMPR